MKRFLHSYLEPEVVTSQIMKMNRSILLNLAIRYLLILLFVYAAISKLIDFPQFQKQLEESPLLTRQAPLFSWLVPITEIAISLCLLFDRTQRPGLYASFMLMAMFSGYIVVITRFSPSTPCSCGGVLQGMTWDQHLLFNLVFTGLCAVAIWPLTASGQTPQRFIAINRVSRKSETE